MTYLRSVGRILFAIAFLAFGVQHLIYSARGAGLGPPWAPAYHVIAAFAGLILISAGLGLITGIKLRLAATAVAALSFARALIVYAPKLAANIRDPSPWAVGFELIAIGGLGLMLAAPRTGSSGALSRLGRILFASGLIVIGAQHFIYGPFIAGLIPAWIPARLFWAYFVGAALEASACAIVTRRMANTAAASLGTMFFLWVLILHGPRVAAALHNGNEWTSLFVALAFSGGAFATARD